MFKLKNQVQNYAWGSKTSIRKLFGIENPNNEPQAEIWMGTHSGGCSRIDDTGQLLSDAIAQNRDRFLGSYTANRFGELPYLFKVLSAQTPLSIQVHPNKYKSEMGFARENAEGIALTDSIRNYKDSNHKPEFVYALTHYKAMNGFRPIEHIVLLFNELCLDELVREVAILERESNNKALREFFSSIMILSEARKYKVLSQLEAAYEKTVLSSMAREAIKYSQEFKKYYERDIGLLAPFILNIVELEPGEAMFLFSGTPHAYVQGTALEIMASSDNVLRAGLTPKHIDILELIDNVVFTPLKLEKLKMLPILKDGKHQYPIPVDDFGFDILHATNAKQEQYVRSAEILFCIDANIVVESQDRSISISPGESVFIPYSAQKYTYRGEGRVARAYN
ncbi:mannose-6-phosphate isomerase, class I [Vibrio sp. 10N.261.49.A5]|uniref:mannose-6-phosphate isomerase n=1 Tax=Vibrio tasmaniensis 1F-267 TaxID=1191324 RepID=A0ABX3B4Y1_9VIBR|nr:mannose-6-phosphate isomerase, class I [Vibrio tasmaniensis]OEF43730.1 mannose-6-phosphate isomerase, class I [Vibrio tasmaniensis 1F-267]